MYKKLRLTFHGICFKLLLVLMLSTFITMIGYSVYFFVSTRQAAIEKYELQTETAFNVSAQNINYYISNCISSAKSIYVNDSLLRTFSQIGDTPFSAAASQTIFQYMQSVYYSTSAAKQIYLAVPRLNRSFLYVTNNLQTSISTLKMTDDDLPSFSTANDIYIQPTHSMATYGHVVGFSRIEPDEIYNLVFTIWLPIYDLPQTTSVIAFLAIDMPIEFVRDNCQLAYSDDEEVFIVDDRGSIVVSTNPDDTLKNVSDVYGMSLSLSGRGFSYTIDKGRLIMQQSMDSEYLDWKIIKTVPTRSIYETTRVQAGVLVAIFMLVILGVVVINAWQILRYTIPLQRVTDYMRLIAESRSWRKDIHLSDFVVYKSNDEVGSLVFAFETMLTAINDYTIRHYELELAYTRSVLKMLQAQINPHFIYNTIQCFATNALRKQDLEQYRLISSFGHMMHYVMVLEPAAATLRQELDYVRRYIDLQKMRFKSEDTPVFEVDPRSEDIIVPKVVLQPLVENSILHGKLFQSANSVLRITTGLAGGKLTVAVADNGVPVSEENSRRIQEALAKLRASFSKSAQQSGPQDTSSILQSTYSGSREHSYNIGIANVFARLFLHFGECDFEICANELGGTTTFFSIPYEGNVAD